MRIRSFLGVIALAGTGLSACGGGDGGGGPNPTPGTLYVVLTNAPSAPGAIMFTVSGGAITGVVSSYTGYESVTASNSRKVLLTGDLIAGTLLVQIQVPDIAKVDNYVVQVLQVAARSTAAIPYQNLGTGGFTMDVTD
jgi:hypothetical protein